MIDAWRDNQRGLWEVAIAAAWHAEAFARSSKLKPLDEYIRRERKPAPPQTEAQMFSNLKAWLQMNGTPHVRQ